MKDKTLLEQVLGLERLRSEYQKRSGNDVSDDLAFVDVGALPSCSYQAAHSIADE